MADLHTEPAPANDNGGTSVGRQDDPREVVTGTGGDFTVAETSAAGEFDFLAIRSACIV